MFQKILIANRGEIACRVMRTARRLGVRTVAVYSDADANALHARMADEAVHIGAAPVGESYLRGDRIIDAALRSGAQAIHPGYGFLSENPGFVDMVTAAGLVFIGPSAASIRAMGLKDAAKLLMEKAGVPVVPGYHGDSQSFVLLAGKANDVGYPVLIKARAGGGGKGMRRVDHHDDFAEALAAARREAKAAFGDEAVLIEKYIETPRHIEVQVFGDNYGNAVHLFERDCSAQRRHQKVIEEAPAPGMSAEMRQAMTDAAVKAAKAISYSGAGTVEFIVDASEGLRPDRFWFMEMNTRLQVEHPVTEMITGLDLVEWQLRVAAGEPLPAMQEQIHASGHAFEARVYAEDPARGFLPAIGTLQHLRFPQGADIRVDSGVRQGDAVSPYYDPMIAKLVVHGPSRGEALARLVAALERTEIAGLVTNTAFLRSLALDPDFASGRVDTGMIARRQDALTEVPPLSPLSLASAFLASEGVECEETGADPWARLSGYTHFHPLVRTARLHQGERDLIADVVAGRDGTFSVQMEGSPAVKLNARDMAPHAEWQGHMAVFEAGAAHVFDLRDPLSAAENALVHAGDLRAPMPGLVKLVRVQAGESVSKGQPLLVLEAMKMEHAIVAPRDGLVAAVVAEGAQVTDGTVLVRFEDPTDG
ncbi:MAG: acetyl/propionyl/methylcrotonyl-CoA carboxylase subunit alpha [Rhizobiaceae bacterium]|nr:acetyl/propionyl/methylcrotonyl-CoA carboxylase subunit alpha [Rhizobiaceae bacterium]